jgi:hypothetical protein
MVAEMLKILKHVDLLEYVARDSAIVGRHLHHFQKYMSPQKVNKLVMQGRLVPILQKTEEGKVMILGYRRKGNSRKSNQVIQFAQPQEVPELSRTLANPSVPMPATVTLPEPVTLT